MSKSRNTNQAPKIQPKALLFVCDEAESMLRLLKLAGKLARASENLILLTDMSNFSDRLEDLRLALNAYNRAVFDHHREKAQP